MKIPASRMELLYLDQNYLSGIVKGKVAFRELEPALRAAVARGAVGVPESEAHRLESCGVRKLGPGSRGWAVLTSASSSRREDVAGTVGLLVNSKFCPLYPRSAAWHRPKRSPGLASGCSRKIRPRRDGGRESYLQPFGG
jgi:hypothetical protein